LAVACVQAREQFGDTDTEPVLASEKAGKGKKNLASATAQEAHEAVRPSILVESNRFRTPKEMGAGWIADKKKLDLYTLIYERTLASVMKDAKMERKTVAVEARTRRGGEGGANHLAELVVTGQTILTRGFLRALREEEQAPTASLSPTGPGSDPDAPPPSLSPSFLGLLTPGQALSCLGTKVLLHATSPPYRYTQGSFVRTVEELGIGRPSTYATIIEVLKTRRYVGQGHGTGRGSSRAWASTPA
jgi:DNA topoisomerase-1